MIYDDLFYQDFGHLLSILDHSAVVASEESTIILSPFEPISKYRFFGGSIEPPQVDNFLEV